MERRTLLKRRLLRRKKRRYTQLLNQLRAELRAAYLATVAASSPANPIVAVAKEASLLHGSPKPPTTTPTSPPVLAAFIKSHPLVANDVIPTLLFKHVNPPPSVFASKRRQPRDDILTGVKGDGTGRATNGGPKLEAKGAQLEATLRMLGARQKPKSPPKPPKKYSEKMKAEASILQRISELQKEGLWSDKRLPKVREPDRKKSHWDYVLEEAAWMQMDFHQERKWKQAASKRISRAVQRHFAQKELAVEREKREEEIKKRRVASSIARDVNRFWSNVKKVVELRELSRIEDLRKSALDEQLSFIVDQTEKYSGLLAKKFKRAGGDPETPTPHPLSDGEFELGSASSGDDEETIEVAEAGLAAEEVTAEVDLLQKESQMELDDILSELPAGYLSALRSPQKEVKEEKGGRALVKELVGPHEVSLGDDADFSPPSDVESDNEATLAAEEAREGKVDHKEEVDQLEQENELSVEELFKLHYGGVKEEDLEALQELEGGGGSETPTEDEDEEEEDEEEEEEEEEEESESEEEDKKEKAQDSELASLLKSFAPGKGEGKEEEAEEGELGSVAALAESFQPKGSTYSSTQVVTRVPPLIKHTLREYQHIGLDWLVAMYEKRLNGILADEMGLGKTIQTISLLAYLAFEKGEWGPHLIVVPTSVMLNWEMEFKKWAPGLKLLTYYGSQKERKAKRHGWTKHNSFHVCITSYKLVIQDHQSFRRKRWTYFILDEAQNIKNFKSQRWQLLLNFNSSRRLLLTGTPLQNNLMELWSLMHFLMPNVFQSHREFREWFSNPVAGMVEGNADYNENIIRRLHKVLRPFILRRLKSEVEKQLPSKYEHLVLCKLSKRQRFLYEEFMSRSRTKETLNSGNLLSVINVLMQLRKVCNHPNLFEPRPVISPFHADGIHLTVPSLVWNIHEQLSYHKPSYPLFQLTEEDVSPSGLSKEDAWRVQSMAPGWNYGMSETASLNAPPARLAVRSDTSTAKWYDVSTVKFFRGRSVFGSKEGGPPPPKKPRLGLAEEVGAILERLKEAPPPMPVRPFPMHLFLTTHDPDKAGLFEDSEFMTYVNRRFNVEAHPPPIQSPPPQAPPAIVAPPPPPPPPQATPVPPTSSSSVRRKESLLLRNGVRNRALTDPPDTLRLVSSRRRRSVLKTANDDEGMKKARLTDDAEGLAADGDVDEDEVEEVVVRSRKGRPKPLSGTLGIRRLGINPLEFQLPEIERRALLNRGAVLRRLERLNNLRCERSPVYGRGLYESVGVVPWVGVVRRGGGGAGGGLAGLWETLASKVDGLWRGVPCWSEAVLTLEERLESLRPVLSRFVIYVPPVASPTPLPTVFHPAPSAFARHKGVVATLASSLNTSLLHPIVSSMATQFPDPRLIQYDCGKLQRLQLLLRELKAGSHRVLIFTQMAKMLDVLEQFLNYHGHIYLRLDGATKIDQRQLLMERFNTDKRIFVFILSTRSGGIGVNLTGADTVIFYDSDWNPTMDAQAQDRCHRIGQTRDVHIYRLVCEKTVEENILKKSNQKRMLGELAIEGGNFTTAFFTKSTIHDLFKTEAGPVLEEDSKKRLQLLGFNMPAAPVKEQAAPAAEEEVRSGDATQMFESALLAAEDEMDAKAARNVRAEADAELAEFDETIDLDELDGGAKKRNGEKRNEIDDIFEQLNGVELYAVRMMEETLEDWSTETYAAAQKEIEKQKQEWEDAQLRTLQQLEEEKEAEEEEESLTYAANSNKVWVAQRPEITNMPIWNPPTPPTDDADVLMPVDSCYAYLYCNDLMPESQLPSVFAHKVSRKVELSSKPLPSLLQPEFDVSETDESSFSSPCKKSSPSKLQRRDEPIFAPRSLFDRPSPALAKLRRDFKVQKHNNRTVGPPQKQTLGPGAISFPIISPNSAKTPPTPPADMIEWLIHEDFELLKVVQQLLELPSSLLVVNLAQTPNWDLASEVVSMSSRTFRTPKQCKWRYENIVGPREEGKLFYESPLSPTSSPTSKKKKSQKTFIKITPPSPSKASRYLKTSQLMTQDNNAQATNFYTSKFDVIKAIANKRAPTSKPMTVTPSVKLNKQAGIFSEYGINYDSPMPATAIAQSRQERLQQERKRIIAQHQQSLQASGLMSPGAAPPASPVAVTQGPPPSTPSTPPTPDKAPPVMRGYVPATAASSLLEAQKRAQAQANATQQKPLRPQEFIVLQKAQQSAAPTTPPTIQMVSPKPPLLIHHQTLVALSQASPTHIVTSTSSTASKTPTLQRTLTMQDLVSSASQSPTQAPQTLVSLTPVTKVLGSATSGATTFVQTSASGARLATLGPAAPPGQQLQNKPTGAPVQVQYIRQGNVIRSQPVISTASQQVAAAGGKEGIKRIQVVSSSAPLPVSIATSAGGAIFTQATTPASGITASALTQQKGVPMMTLSSAQSALGQLGQGRPVQLVKQQTIGGKTVTRTVTEAEIATLLKQHGLTPASPARSLASTPNTVVVSSGGKGGTPATPFSTTTILTSMGIQNLIRAPGTTTGGQITTYVKSQPAGTTPQTQGGTLTIPVPLSQIKTIGATLNKGSPRVTGPPAQHHYVVHTSGRVGATAGKNIYLPTNQLTPRFQTQVIRSVDFTRPMQLSNATTPETWRGGRLPSIRPVETSSAPTMISASMLNSPLTHRFVTMNNPNSPFQKTIQVVHGGQGGTIIGPGMTLARPPVPGATGTYQTIRVQQGQAVMVNNTPITPTSTVVAAAATSTPAAATTSTATTTTTSIGVVVTGSDVGGGGGGGGGAGGGD